MIGIEAIGSYFPDSKIDNISRCSLFGTDQEFISNKIGFESLLRKAVHEDTSDLCVSAWENLHKENPCTIEEIQCIVVCTQTPDGYGLPQTSAIVQHKLGCSDHVAAFDISLGCSGYIYGIEIIKSFMNAHGMQKGLFFTADPYSKIMNPDDRNTELLFGDAATCTLFSATPRYLILKSQFATDGAGSEAIQRRHPEGKLEMNGQKVFMFVMKKIPPQIRSCLQANNLHQDDIDIFLFHQGSKFIVEMLRSRLSLAEHQAPFLAHETGNTVSSSIPLSLQTLKNKKYTHILLSGFGVGLSWATTIIRQQ
ncbi:MAG: ketoacyl-ACP synthase III [Candidatus Electrothrix sp. Rat3]|nr:ketoacyl-ACP synthase III [Candidatus Electrothrix rattekaaiensis]